ncbi:hypothetical protein DH2020_030920 [Rehmannia glutinosa]|uniref:Protein kinase domain-containing protein n=1 Tax=Rehmannia glutinosa TaxID=99300 RepID=A0ABR0VJE1_REHGL
MSMIYDNWERLMAAVVKREEIWQLCHQHSRSHSICSESSDFSVGSQLSDVNLQKKEESVLRPVHKLVFLGGSTPGFSLKDILSLNDFQELGKGTSGTTILTHLLQDVQVSDQDSLVSGTKVVMKLLNEVKVTEEEFKQHMKVLGNCRHENVSAPRAYYFSNQANGMFVVYDYHSQGSLSDMLHGNKSRPNWESRLKIATGAAGIAHIHKQFGGKLAHGNIKSSNIFLNSQHYGCVSDFSLSGIMVKNPPQWGTLGYHAPAYDYKTVSQESDVYSFGNLLLELLTGKSPMQAQGFEKDLHLVSWACSVKPEEWTSKLFDQSLRRPIRHEKDVLEMMQTEIPGVHLPSVTDWEAVRTILGSHFRSMSRVPADYFTAQDMMEMTEMFEVTMRCLGLLTEHLPKMSDVVVMLQNIGKPKTDPNIS